MKSHEVYGSCGADGHYINIIYCSWRRQQFFHLQIVGIWAAEKDMLISLVAIKRNGSACFYGSTSLRLILNFIFYVNRVFWKQWLILDLIVSCSKKISQISLELRRFLCSQHSSMDLSSLCLWTGFPFGEQELEEVVWAAIVQISLKKKKIY